MSLEASRGYGSRNRALVKAEKNEAHQVWAQVACCRVRLQNWKGRTHGQFRDSVSVTLAVRYEMGWYPADVAVSAVFRRNSRLLCAFRDEPLESHSGTLLSFSDLLL